MSNDVVEKQVYSPSCDMHGDVMNNANEVPKNAKQSFPKTFMPLLLFPQRMAKAKVDLQFRKFLKALKKLYINIHQCLV